jgi:hypothetical protein
LHFWAAGLGRSLGDGLDRRDSGARQQAALNDVGSRATVAGNLLNEKHHEIRQFGHSIARNKRRKTV